MTAIVGILGIVIGSLLTYIVQNKMQKLKFDFDKEQAIFNIKRQKLEDMFILIDNTLNFSKKTMNEFIMLNSFKNIEKLNISDTSSVSKFLQFKNYVHMYFYDDNKLIGLLTEAEVSFNEAKEVNGKVFNSIHNTSNKEDMKKLNGELLLANQKFQKFLEQINIYLPEIYKKMITKKIGD